MSEYIVDLPTSGAADEFFKMREMPDMTLYGYPLTGEITRCRDCIYCDKYKNDEICVCYRFDNEQPEVEPDGFCAWASRKEVGE